VEENAEPYRRSGGNDQELSRPTQPKTIGTDQGIPRIRHYDLPLQCSIHDWLTFTIDGWRKSSDKDGWRRRPRGSLAKPPETEFFKGDEGQAVKEWDVVKTWVNDEVDDSEKLTTNDSDETPLLVKAAPRLLSDMLALKSLFRGSEPPVRDIRCCTSTNFYYGFGDASDTSFGSSFEKDQRIEFEYGQWCTESSEQSSN